MKLSEKVEAYQTTRDAASPKLCECGCGQPTRLARDTDSRRGNVRGQPQRFVLGHSRRDGDAMAQLARDVAARDGMCACGCGRRAPLAATSNLSRGNLAGHPQKFIRGHTLRPLPGEANPAWKGGRKAGPSGYIAAYAPGHPRATKNYVLEHLLVAERALGRLLRGSEEVHHVDRNRANNDPGNLVICPDRAYHMLLHRRERALRGAE